MCKNINIHRNHFLKYIRFVAVLILGLCISGSVWAQQSQKDITQDFLQAAFTSKMWKQTEYQEKHAGWWPSLFGHSEANYWLSLIEDETPWIAPFVARMGKDLPKDNVIHKWKGDISIGFDIPPYGKKCEKVAAGRHCVNWYSYAGGDDGVFDGDMYKTLEAQVLSLIPDMEVATKRRVTFIRNDTAEEKSRKHAKIRIVWMRGNAQKNYFKSFYPACNSDSCSVSSAGWYAKIREYLWGAVPFTPDARAQLDGYLLPYGDNNIGLAICRINPLVGADLVKSLVTECLIRSLGFTGLLEEADSALGRWNKAHEPHSMRVGIDEGAYLPRGHRYFSTQPFPHELTNKDNLKLSLSEKDRRLVRLLYCDDIQSGMTPEDVRKVLQEKKCQ